VVRAFHNVCRHRAYTITKKESGSSTVLGCRYHGWSYNTRGGLIKAPHFENVPGFDKAQNGLFEIHAAMSKDGLILINLDANPTVPEVNFESADAFTAQQRLGVKSTWIGGSTFEGNFNWKAAGGFTVGCHSEQTAYHRKISVESVLFDLRIPGDRLPRSLFTSIFQSLKNRSSERQQLELRLFPNCTLYRIRGTGLWYSLCLLPTSEAHTRVRCDLYSISSKVDSAAGTVSEKLNELLCGRIKDVEKEFVSSSAGSRYVR
jgi:nitrite reductase/ring-hydroxylating ferredoxin subunit